MAFITKTETQVDSRRTRPTTNNLVVEVFFPPADECVEFNLEEGGDEEVGGVNGLMDGGLNDALETENCMQDANLESL